MTVAELRAALAGIDGRMIVAVPWDMEKATFTHEQTPLVHALAAHVSGCIVTDDGFVVGASDAVACATVFVIR